MHVLLLHQAFVSPREAGGTRHFEFAKRCIKRGHRFTIVASNVSYLDGKQNTAKAAIVTAEKIEGVDVLRAYTYAVLHKSFIWRAVCFFCFMVTSVVAGMRAKDVDLVIGTSPPMFQALSAWLVAKLKGIPFLLEIRDLWPAFAIDIGVLKNPFLIWLASALERFLYAQATHIMVNSPAYRDYLIKKGIPRSKISLIPNGVDPDMFDPAKSRNGFRKSFNLDGKFVVTYAGALGISNDIPTILQAAEKLKEMPEIHFLLVGDGMERPHLEARKQEMGLENVTFTGIRPKSEMPDILAASDICLATLKNIPMFKTTYPNKVFDYMAAGRPTVLAIDGVIRDVLEAANAGLFASPGNSQALADTVSWMYGNPDERLKMGASARSYVVKHFNRNCQAEQFIELVQSFRG